MRPGRVLVADRKHRRHCALTSRKPSPKKERANQIEPDLIVIDLYSGFGRDA